MNLYKSISLPKATISGKYSMPWMESTNIVFVGLDEGKMTEGGISRQADTVIVISIYHNENRVKLLFIPRNTKVAILGYDKGYGSLSDTYNQGGAVLLAKTIEDLLHMPLHYYLSVDIDSLIKLIDWLGGLDHYVEKDMIYEGATSGPIIHLVKGYQHLDGKRTSDYVRFVSDEFGEIGRIQRQQRLVRSLITEKMDAKTLLLLPYLENHIDNYVKTDMTFIDLLRLVNSLKYFNFYNTQMEILSGHQIDQNGRTFWLYTPK